MKKQLDLRGLSCPEPVLRTKKIIDDAAVSSVEALVDNEVNVQNLERLARSQKMFLKTEAMGDHFRVNIERSEGAAGEAAEHAHHTSTKTSARVEVTRGGGTIIFISKDTFGSGSSGAGADTEKDHAFSHNLLDVFLQTIQQSGLKPRAILMANSGVKLIDPASSTYKVLSDLKADGVTVLACGLCLDYYGLKAHVPVEQVTNMFAICEYLFAADQVLSP